MQSCVYDFMEATTRTNVGGNWCYTKLLDDHPHGLLDLTYNLGFQIDEKEEEKQLFLRTLRNGCTISWKDEREKYKMVHYIYSRPPKLFLKLELTSYDQSTLQDQIGIAELPSDTNFEFFCYRIWGKEEEKHEFARNWGIIIERKGFPAIEVTDMEVTTKDMFVTILDILQTENLF